MLRDGYICDSEINTMIKYKPDDPPILDEKIRRNRNTTYPYNIEKK